jgi:RNA polymerase sigma-B factor
MTSWSAIAMTSPQRVSTTPVHPHHLETATTRQRRVDRTDEIIESLLTCTDPAEIAGLRDELVTLHLPVATSIASRYRSRGIATEDLNQVAYLALTKAAHRFDPRQGHVFLTFCAPTIRGEIRRHFRDHGWVVRPPRRIQELQQRISRAETELSARLGRPPGHDEIAAELDEPLSEVLEAGNTQGCFTPASLDRPVDTPEGASTMGELIGEIDPHQPAIEARVALAPVVRRLSVRDRRILQLRFYEDMTQHEIAQEIGVTQMQVSRLLTRIMRDLRRGLGSLDGSETAARSA